MPLIRVGLTPEPGAFTTYDAIGGTASGATVEVLKAIAALQDLTPTYVLFHGSGSNPGVAALNDDRIDVIAYTFQITPERTAQVDFSVPVLSYGEALVVQARDRTAYRTSADLAGRTIGVIAGSNYVGIAERAGATTVVGTSLAGAVAEVDAGRIDAVIGTAPTLTYVVRHGAYPNVRLVTDYVSSDALPAGFGVKKGNAALLAALDAGLAQLKADGSLDRILAAYGLSSS
jgi:polar amino acid transport system substrate-binding protein